MMNQEPIYSNAASTQIVVSIKFCSSSAKHAVHKKYYLSGLKRQDQRIKGSLGPRLPTLHFLGKNKLKSTHAITTPDLRKFFPAVGQDKPEHF